MIDFMLTGKDAKLFITKLNNINQVMKSMRYDSSYTIYNESCFASPNGINKPNSKGGYDKVDIGRTYASLNINLGELTPYALYIHNGKALYQFIKEFKKFIESISISFDESKACYYLGLYAADNVFLIPILRKENQLDVLMHEEMLDIFRAETRYPEVDYLYTLSYEDILLIAKDKTIPHVLHCNDCKVRTTRKMLVGMTTNDEIQLSFYQTIDPYYFIAIFAIFRKEMTVYHAYKCVKY